MKITISRKLVVSVVSVLAVAAMAALGGISWSQASESPSGVQLVAEDHLATLTVTDIQPGDEVTRLVTIRNSADRPARLAFTEQGDPADYRDGQLVLSVDADGRQVYEGQFGAMADLTQDMGQVGAGESVTFRFTVSLPDEVTYLAPGRESATASYAWVLVPV
ncbi:MAG: hypothetical protein Q7J48_18495 [Nocardioides sp.]|nr:hypothetical protein [Nocardioides sp.]